MRSDVRMTSNEGKAGFIGVESFPPFAPVPKRDLTYETQLLDSMLDLSSIKTFFITIIRVSFLGPPPFTQGNVQAVFGSTTVHLRSPGKIFAETNFSVRGIVKVDLRDGGLNQGPDAPI